MPLMYMKENIPLKQNKNVKRIFTPVMHEKRNDSLKQDKFSTWVLLYASSQSGLP